MKICAISKYKVISYWIKDGKKNLGKLYLPKDTCVKYLYTLELGNFPKWPDDKDKCLYQFGIYTFHKGSAVRDTKMEHINTVLVLKSTCVKNMFKKLSLSFPLYLFGKVTVFAFSKGKREKILKFSSLASENR